jgi:hypothetical protein
VSLLLACFTGCAPTLQNPDISHLESPDPALRIRAIKWAGENKMVSAVPLLVDRLQETDASIRFFAISALKKITGTDYGYDYKADANERAAAVQKWHAYLDKQYANH